MSEPRHAEALWYVGEKTCEIRSERLPHQNETEAHVATSYSLISRGTERLVFQGRVPKSVHARMRAPFQVGEFTFPVKYGYACVGKVTSGPADWLDRHVFCLHPHQTSFVTQTDYLTPVPDTVPVHRAVLAANMETALNALWDGKPSPADQICVVGAGVVGLLTAYLCQKIPGTSVTVVDINPARGGLANRLGCKFALPDNAPEEQDIVFHASASSSGLQTALSAAGKGATVVELSWYGDKPVTVNIGAEFHSQRLTLLSSQVGSLPADRQDRWTFKRRLHAAMKLLNDPVLDALLTYEVAFRDLPSSLPALLTEQDDILTPLVRYD